MVAAGPCGAIGSSSTFPAIDSPVWVLIGVFAAAFFALIGIVTTNFNRTMDARFDAVRADINAKFDITNVKLENLNREVQAISRQVFGADPR